MPIRDLRLFPTYTLLTLLTLWLYFQVPLWPDQTCMFPGRRWGWRWGRPGAAGCWRGPPPPPCPWSVWGPVSSQNVLGSFPLGRWCCAWRTQGSPPGWNSSRPTNGVTRAGGEERVGIHFVSGSFFAVDRIIPNEKILTSESWRGTRAGGSFHPEEWRRGSSPLPSAWTGHTGGSWRHPAAEGSGREGRSAGGFWGIKSNKMHCFGWLLWVWRCVSIEDIKRVCELIEITYKELTMNESVRSGMPVSFTQASITPWISAVIVEPEDES